jgi:hypothetical protein
MATPAPRPEVVQATFEDVEHILQLALIVCNQGRDRVIAACVGAIVAVVGSSTDRCELLEQVERSIAKARENYGRRPLVTT